MPGEAGQHLLHAPQLLRGVLLKLVLRRFRFPREIALRNQTEPCNDVDDDPARNSTVHIVRSYGASLLMFHPRE
jgi:hypothetical protein